MFPGSVVDFNARYDPDPSARLYKKGQKLQQGRKGCQSARKNLGKMSLLHGSSPCQGFSGANRRGGQNDKDNNELSYCVVDGVRIIQPDIAVFENVLGMWKRKNQRYVRTILSQWMNLGYQVRCCKLISSDYGDPQTRPRLFFFAAKQSVYLPNVPPKTHGGPDSGLYPYVTVGEALRGVTDDMANSECSNSAVSVRLRADGLAPTITGQSVAPYHPTEDRCITVREAACLQSLPHDYEICGTTLRDQYKQVGNAVPVMLATAVAQSVRRALAYRYEEDSDR